VLAPADIRQASATVLDRSRLRYDGEARRHAAEDCAVAVSARTGKLVAAKHPSGARAAAGKLRRLFSFK